MGWGSAVFPLLIVTPSGGFTGLFLYSPGPGTGNLIGSWTAQAGTDPYGNSFPAGINVTAGNLSNVTLQSINELMNPGPFLLDAPGDQTISVFTTVGVNNWVAPAGVTSVQVFCTGPGGNGGTGFAPGFGGGGGGGGEQASATIAVTPGNTYHPTVGAPGSQTTFAGDVVTVTANPGSNGVNGTSGANGTGGPGGTGSTNATHFNGGKGGNAGLVRLNSGGGGGGAAASSVQTGDAGENPPSAGLGGLGGTASPGFPGSGGAGGNGGIHSGAGHAGLAPGGGGGGGGDGAAGGAGANGQVVLVYSTLSVSTFVTLATSAGNDPVTGHSFSPGITTIDPVFGDTWRTFGATTVISASAVWNITGADISAATLGQGFRIKEGTNGRMGRATLAAGTVTVANTTVTASTEVTAFAQDNNSTGSLRCSARVAGTSFTITSSNAADNGVVCWRLWEPG